MSQPMAGHHSRGSLGAGRRLGAYGCASIAACLMMTAAPARAQEKSGLLHDKLDLPKTFILSGSSRWRYEALDGQSRAGFALKDDLLSIRTTLLGEYRGDGFRIGAEIYDSRAYGANRGSSISTSEVNALELVQAYVTAKDVALPGFDAKADVQLGRFMMNIGGRRLVAADDYRNTTNSFTGIRVDVESAAGTTATLFYTLPQQRRPDDDASIRDNKVKFDKESFDIRLWGGLVSKADVFGKTLAEVSYYGLAERDMPGQPNRNRHLHTVGARLIREAASGEFDYEFEGFYQFGRVRASSAATAASLDVSAWFSHAEIGYSFPGPLKARLALEHEYTSGDGRGRSFNRFDTLYGSRRSDLVPSGIFAQIGRANINTPAVRLEIAPSKRIEAFVLYRAMWLASRTDSFSTSGVRDVSGRSGSFAGHIVEGRVRHWIVPKLLRSEVNVAWLAKGRFLTDAPNAPPPENTRYLSVALTAFF